MAEKKTAGKIDSDAKNVVSCNQKQVLIDRLYGHRSTLRGMLNETDRIIEWLQRPNSQ
jgi:hypothetical protein